jgi:uncharacterized protein YdhG (YjbR/CyaY superfamily)
VSGRGESRVLPPSSPRRRAVTRARTPIDDYLDGVDEPARGTLRALRETILRVVPDAKECISYRLPAFRVHGKVVAGFGAFTKHLAYLPHSGSVLRRVRGAGEYGGTKSSLHFAMDTPLPDALVRELVTVRLAEIEGR